jgi:hypothetical protein
MIRVRSLMVAMLEDRGRRAALETHGGRTGQVGGDVRRHARGGRVHEEDPGAAFVGQRRGHDEDVGGAAAHHRVRHAVEGPHAVGHGGAYAVRARGPTTAGRGVGRCEHDLAGGEPAEQVRPLLGRAHRGDQPAGVHDAGDVRLGREHPAELLAHDADLDRSGADATVGLAEGQAEDAHLGQPAPEGAVEAVVGGDRPAPRLVVGVRAREQAAHGLTQRLLLVVVGEVHVVPLRVPGWCG